MYIPAEAYSWQAEKTQPGFIDEMLLKRIGNLSATLPENFIGRWGGISVAGSNVDGQARVMMDDLSFFNSKILKRIAIDVDPDAPTGFLSLEASFRTYSDHNNREETENLQKYTLGQANNDLSLFRIMKFVSLTGRIIKHLPANV